MSPECKACNTRIRCPVSIPHTPRACRIIKVGAAVGYIGAFWLAYRSAQIAHVYIIPDELGVFLLLRTSLISALFITTMWAMNHLIACSERGGIIVKGPSHE